MLFLQSFTAFLYILYAYNYTRYFDVTEHCRQVHQERFLKLEKKINYLIQVARSGDENRNLSQNRQIEIDAFPDFHLQSKNAVDAFESQLSSNAVCTQFVSIS